MTHSPFPIAAYRKQVPISWLRRWIFLAFAAALPVQADLVVEQRVESEWETTKITVSIKGDRIRTDVDDTMTTIVDINRDEVVEWMHEQKLIKKSNPKALLKELGVPTPPLDVPKVTRTGKTEKIDGHVCEIVLVETLLEKKTKLWVAKGYPDYSKFKKDVETLTRFGHKSKKVDLGGMPLKIESENKHGKQTSTTVSVSHSPLKDDMFEAPAGYTELPTGN